jgi:D-alanyl-D-alanine-carboxypeptidase/D-alanyl-D-alanine-endopeptidase
MAWGQALLAVSLAWSGAAASYAATPAHWQDLPDIVKRRVEADQRAPAVLVLTIAPDGQTHVDAAGVCCGSGTAAADGATVFEIGSITKVFTAVLLADMVLNGEVKLDDPLQMYLPDGVKAPEKDGKPILLWHLAEHASGLPRMPADFRDEASYTEAMLLAALDSAELEAVPGTALSYSNFGFGVLGYALARKAGKPYGELIDELIFKPLKMEASRVGPSDMPASRVAIGHDPDGNAVPASVLGPMNPAGGITASADDMALFIKASLNPDGTRLGKALAYVNAPDIRPAGSDEPLTLGWGRDTVRDVPIMQHDGGTTGFSSFAAFNPVARTGVVALSNSNYPVQDIGVHALVPAYPVAVKKTAIVLEPEALPRFAGVYVGEDGSRREILPYGGRLFSRRDGPMREVFPESAATFFFPEGSAFLQFEGDGPGAPAAVVVFQNDGSSARQTRQGDLSPGRVPVVLGETALAGFAGTYRSDGGGVFVVTLEDGRMRIKLDDQEALEVFPMSETRVFYADVNAEVGFEGAAGAPATALVLYQNGNESRAERVVP